MASERFNYKSSRKWSVYLISNDVLPLPRGLDTISHCPEFREGLKRLRDTYLIRCTNDKNLRVIPLNSRTRLPTERELPVPIKNPCAVPFRRARRGTSGRRFEEGKGAKKPGGLRVNSLIN